MPDITIYTDYRAFLKDFYIERKSRDSSFSYRRFAEKAGFKSKTFLFKVMTGEKALSTKAIRQVSDALELNRRDSRYFEALVRFNESRTTEEKERRLLELNSIRSTGNVVLRQNQYEYFARWYHCVIRELVTARPFHGDYEKLGQSVAPPITARQAKKSVELLEKLMLIEKTPDGGYRRTRNAITTGDEVVSLAVRKFQAETLRLAGNIHDRIPREHRDISTVTMGISGKTYEKLKEEVCAFRKRCIRIADADEIVDRVYQLNVQFFPVSAIPDENDKPDRDKIVE